MKNSQIGRSMIEMLGVLAIIGVLSVGGIAGYSSAMNKLRINKTITLMTTIYTNLNNLAMRSTRGLNTTAAIKFKAIPEENIVNNSLVHPFGGSIDIGNIEIGSYPNLYYIAFNSLTTQACMDIAAKDFGESLIYVSQDTFSSSANSNLNFSTSPRNTEPLCSSGADFVYCLKKVIPPSQAANACKCKTKDSCSITMIAY